MFENIIGNDKVKRILSEIKEPSHAYMFLGTDGIGKYLFAKEFAYKWLCVSDKRPCGKCKSCIQFSGNNNMDLNVIEPEGNSIKVEQIRELIKNVYEKPIESYKKVYIINDADKMSDAAQNAFLKVLEEPPIYIIIILISSNEHLFLNTLKSRCIKINFQRIEMKQLKEFFKNNDILINEKLLSLCDGSIGKAKELKKLENNYLELENLILNIKNIKKLDFIKKCTSLITKDNINEMLECINNLLFKLGKNELIYLNLIEEVNMAIKQYKSNCNVEMILDNLFLNIYEISNYVDATV